MMTSTPNPVLVRRRAQGSWIVAAALAATAALVAPVHAQFNLGRISGVVTNETGTPIAGVVVRADNPTASPATFTDTTDDKGEFAILGLGRGLWTITFSATLFEPAEINLPVRTRTNTPPMRVTLRPSRTRGARRALAAVDVEALQADLDEAAALAADGRIDEALAIYDRTVAGVPALTSIHRQMGDLYLRKKDHVHALEAYQRLLDARPDDADARAAVAGTALELGVEAERTGDREVAIGYLERALAADPDGPRADEARAALARLRLDRGTGPERAAFRP